MYYIFIAPHVKAFIMSTYASLKQMIMRLEPDELDSCHDASDHRTVVNPLHAKEIWDEQERISREAVRLHLHKNLVPDALAMWNICRLKLGRGKVSAIFRCWCIISD